MDKTLLILGAGPDQIPGILKSKEMGFYTIALDGNSHAIGKKYADEFYVVSVKHVEQIEDFIQNKLTKKVDGVIAFGVDIASIISKTTDMLNVNYTIPLASALLSEDKFVAKEFMRDNGIAIPEYRIVNNVKDIELFTSQYGFPIVIKPVDNSAARGISYISTLENIEDYYSYALNYSPSKKVLIENYLDGYQVSTESFIINGEVYNIGFADRNYSDMEKFFPNIIENGGDLPSMYMKDKHKQQLTQYLKIISEKLNITNGIIKGDIVVNNDELYIIEFALRLSGGNFSTIEIPENTGIDFLQIAIKLHLNIEIEESELKQTKNSAISIRYKFAEESKKDIIKEIHIPKNKEYIIASDFHIQAGNKVSLKTTDHAKRLGFVIAKGSRRDEAIKNAQEFLDSVEMIFE